MIHEVKGTECLVLGGNGFLGTHLVDLLDSQGAVVTVFDSGYNFNRKQPNGVCFIQSDWNNEELLLKALSGVKVVFHLISTTVPKSSMNNFVFDIFSNVISTIKLLKLCVKANINRVVFASSGGTVYGLTSEDPIAESHITNPICSYGLTKLIIEKYLFLFRQQYGLDYVILRPSNAYGAYQNLNHGQGAIGVFLSGILNRQTIEIWGDGSVVRDYVYAGDIAEAFVKAANYNGDDRIFNIGSGVGISLNSLVENIFEVTGRKLPICYSARRSFDVPFNVLDIKHAKKHLNWTPKTSLQEGLKLTWEWRLKKNMSFKPINRKTSAKQLKD